jgi:hypothetical protein
VIKNIKKMTDAQLLDELSKYKANDPIILIFAFLKEIKLRLTGEWIRYG